MIVDPEAISEIFRRRKFRQNWRFGEFANESIIVVVVVVVVVIAVEERVGGIDGQSGFGIRMRSRIRRNSVRSTVGSDVDFDTFIVHHGNLLCTEIQLIIDLTYPYLTKFKRNDIFLSVHISLSVSRVFDILLFCYIEK